MALEAAWVLETESMGWVSPQWASPLNSPPTLTEPFFPKDVVGGYTAIIAIIIIIVIL